MATPQANDIDPDYTSRQSHQVISPERFASWHDYAFSSAPELAHDELGDDTPAAGIPTV